MSGNKMRQAERYHENIWRHLGGQGGYGRGWIGSWKENVSKHKINKKTGDPAAGAASFNALQTTEHTDTTTASRAWPARPRVIIESGTADYRLTHNCKQQNTQTMCRGDVIYIYIYTERERERETVRATDIHSCTSDFPAQSLS